MGTSFSDPTLDLRRNLSQPTDRTVITYRTDRPGGVYLRMASLERFDGDGWRSEGLDLTEGAELPQIPGVSREPGPRRRTTITIDSFDSEYLPLPYAPRRVEAPGSWTFDPTSLVVVAGKAGPGRRQATRNLTYTVDSVDIALDPADLAGSLPVPADAAVTAVVPADLPASISDLARAITADADTAVGQAAAIQTYLRSSRFIYSTEPLPGNGYQALENFLFEDRRGYCEQFAASMAAMVRVLGIPLRIGIGFLPGEQQGDTWRVGIRKMHAWPELFFAGYGWVRFEPTPAGITGTAPDWTVPAAPAERPSSDTPSQAAPQPSISSRPDTPADQPAPHGPRRRPASLAGGCSPTPRSGCSPAPSSPPPQPSAFAAVTGGSAAMGRPTTRSKPPGRRSATPSSTPAAGGPPAARAASAATSPAVRRRPKRPP